MRAKAWAYTYRVTKEAKWADRTWQEFQNAAGNGTESFGEPGDNWYTAHFVDVAEFANAFGIADDWKYDAWSPNPHGGHVVDY